MGRRRSAHLDDPLDSVRTRAAVYRSLLRPGGGDADEAVASAVAGLFTGVLAD